MRGGHANFLSSCAFPSPLMGSTATPPVAALPATRRLAMLPPAALLLVALLLAACGNETAPAPQGRVAASANGPAREATAPTDQSGSGEKGRARSGQRPSSELHVNRTETFYDVTGRSARALLHDLTRRGPRVDDGRAFGRTSWTARWEVTYARPTGESNAPCRMRHADVHMEVEVTLPRWNAPDGAPEALRHDWNNFIDALALHEREHRESIVSAGRRVVRALEELEAPSCPALKDKAGATARPILEEARAYNRRYDERTGHGRTQGARWPPH